MKDIVKVVGTKVKNIFKSEKMSFPHGFNHAKRVQKYALAIAKDGGVDKNNLEIISLAALMHDLHWKGTTTSRGKLLPPGIHGRRSARRAAKILKKLKYPQSNTKQVVKIIQEHEWAQIKNRDLPSQIIWEADKLDGVGSVGVWRVAVTLDKLGIDTKNALKIMDDVISRIKINFKTKTGKKLLKPKLVYMEKYFRNLKKELKSFDF